MFAVAMFSLNGDNATAQYVAMAWPGILVVGGIWLTGLLIGNRNGSDGTNGNDVKPSPPKSPSSAAVPTAPATTAATMAPMNAGGVSLPPGTVAPAPEVTKIMNDLMGGAK
jgi:hypothetical protein